MPDLWRDAVRGSRRARERRKWGPPPAEQEAKPVDGKRQWSTCYRKDGSSKVGWDTKDAAKRHLKRIMAMGGKSTLKVYHCPSCSYYHVGG